MSDTEQNAPTLRNQAGDEIDEHDEVPTSSAAPPPPSARSSAAPAGLPESAFDARPPGAPVLAGGSVPGAAARDQLHARIENDFVYHAPPGPDVTQLYVRIRSQLRGVAHMLVDTVPPGRELARALTHLEDAMMCANAGIARSGPVTEPIE